MCIHSHARYSSLQPGRDRAVSLFQTPEPGVWADGRQATSMGRVTCYRQSPQRTTVRSVNRLAIGRLFCNEMSFWTYYCTIVALPAETSRTWHVWRNEPENRQQSFMVNNGCARRRKLRLYDHVTSVSQLATDTTQLLHLCRGTIKPYCMTESKVKLTSTPRRHTMGVEVKFMHS